MSDALGVAQPVRASRALSSRPAWNASDRIFSLAVGVAQPHIIAASTNVIPSWCLLFGSERSAVLFRPPRESFTVAVGQPTIPATVDGRSKPPAPRADLVSVVSIPRSQSATVGVGHPPETLPDVRRADARSAQIGAWHCIVQCFQVSAYSGEPYAASL